MVENEIKTSPALGEDLSIKDIFKEIIRWKDIGLAYKWIVIAAGILGMTGGFTYAYLSTPLYNADLKFVMRSDASTTSPLAGLSNLLGGGGGATTMSPLARIIELIGSDRIIGNALLKPINVNGNKDLLINHYIELEELRDKWKKDTALSKVKFTPGDKFDELSFVQRKAIKRVSVRIIGKDGSTGIVSKSFDKKSGVVTLTGTYKDEAFAIELTNAIYREIIEFYVDQSVSTTQHNVEILTTKVDSIKKALDDTRRALAENTDQSLGLLLQKNKVENKSLAVKESMLTIMYGEAQKNLETLRFIEASTVPSFSVIDSPYSPIDPVKASKMKSMLIGGMLLGFLMIAFFRAKEVYEEKYKRIK